MTARVAQQMVSLFDRILLSVIIARGKSARYGVRLPRQIAGGLSRFAFRLRGEKRVDAARRAVCLFQRDHVVIV